jgi:serine/threonine protein kinase
MFECALDDIQETYNTKIRIYQVLNIFNSPISPRFRGCYCSYEIFYLIELDSEEVIFYKNEIRECFNRLHEAGIVHNDVAQRDILLHNNQIFIWDFGVSKLRSEIGDKEW